MAKGLITPGQALRRIMSREVANVYTFFGDDIFFHDVIIDGLQKVFNAQGGEKNNLIMGVDSESNLLDQLNMNSLFSEKSIIVVRNCKKINRKYHSDILDYCKSAYDDKILVLIYDDPYAKNKFIDNIRQLSTAIDMRTPFPNKMKEWVIYYAKKNNIKLQDHVVNQLVEGYGDKTSNVVNEIDKLYLYSNSKSGEINSLVSYNNNKKENQVWKLVDSIGRKDLKKSIDIYSNLHNNNTPTIKILLNLFDLFKEMINKKINRPTGKIIRNKILLKNLNMYVDSYSTDEIIYAINILRTCDLVSKTTSIKEKYLIHSMLVDICEGANA